MTTQKINKKMNPNIKQWLISHFGDLIKFNEPMSLHTSFRVGGPADAFVTPENLESLTLLINYAREKDINVLVIGGGSNLLIKDAGIRGIVISLSKCLNRIFIKSHENDFSLIAAQAGASMQSLCSYAIKNNLKGMNFALGIPGTVGGGIMMNSGTARGCVADILKSVLLLRQNGIKELSINKLNISYRTSGIDDKDIVLEGYFCLKTESQEKLKVEAERLLKNRRQRQPTNLPSAGCFFKNPAIKKSAGELIEMAGLKGKGIGGAEISPKHANFIINKNNATAQDILNLMELVKERVWQDFNVLLKPEVRIVGV
ncbi:UDP-N-acetylenolpyruvoylglucosamine reductase [Candidatus Magnetomoraceae bacterium gMMP-13]